MLIRLSDARPDENIRRTIEGVISEAKTEWAPAEYEGYFPRTGFGITELRVKHVPSYGNPYWGSSHYWCVSIGAVNTFEEWINGTMTDMAYIIIEGLFNREPSPKIYEVSPNANGNDLPTISIEHIYTFDMAHAWFEAPFAIKPNSQFIWRNKADGTGLERFGLLGHTIAKRAYLIIR